MTGSKGKRVVILGGGAGGIAAAWRLSDPRYADDIESITVYQRGWRIGGKGASSRGVNGRIEEHGLHVWLGYYDNAFRFMRDVYGELDRDHTDPDCPVRTWWDPDRPDVSAFGPASTIGLHELFDDEWGDWIATFTETGGLPGDVHARTGPMTLLEFVERALRLLANFYQSFERDRGATAPSMGGSPNPPRPDPAGAQRLAVRGIQTAVAGVATLSAAARIQLERSGRGSGEFHAAVDRLSGAVERILARDIEARRLSYLADLILTTVRGILADRLLLDPAALAELNELEYRDWMRKHGVNEATLESPLVRGVYDLVFGYRNGDPNDGQFAAGLGILLSGKLFFDYKGAIFWKMNAGMGDIVFAPAYEALRRRGVRFEFFHRVDDVVPAEDGRSIQRIDGGVQVGLADGIDMYEPLIDVNGLPCFPAEPLVDQLALGDRMPDRFDLEMVWNDWPDAHSFSLEAGRDFDVAILAIPIGMAPYICSRLIQSDSRWAAMAGSLGTVATQAVQLWLRPDMEALGWKHSSITITGFAKPFDTWSSMDHLLSAEAWPMDDRPETLGYFCNTLPTGSPPPADDLEYPRDEHHRVRRHAAEFLDSNVGHYWPEAVDEGGFRWELLAGAGDAEGEDRLDTQFWTANVDPSERYVQSLPGSDRFRMKTDQSGYRNLLLAGDWIDSGLNAGCIEAAVLGGLQAANAALERDRYDDLLGWYPTWAGQEADDE